MAQHAKVLKDFKDPKDFKDITLPQKNSLRRDALCAGKTSSQFRTTSPDR